MSAQKATRFDRGARAVILWLLLLGPVFALVMALTEGVGLWAALGIAALVFVGLLFVLAPLTVDANGRGLDYSK